MRLRNILAAAAATTIFTFPAVQAEDTDAPSDDPKTLLEEISQVTGKAGAMKRDLMENIPEAKELRENIKQLREQAQELDKKLDALLAEHSTEYKAALKRKSELINQYRKALLDEALKARQQN